MKQTKIHQGEFIYKLSDNLKTISKEVPNAHASILSLPLKKGKRNWSISGKQE